MCRCGCTFGKELLYLNPFATYDVISVDTPAEVVDGAIEMRSIEEYHKLIQKEKLCSLACPPAAYQCGQVFTRNMQQAFNNIGHKCFDTQDEQAKLNLIGVLKVPFR